ncbi:hypothetical protein KHA80_13225 [Anaerobacillus sp. HL2]|nr:hypothetical protein KHA80_13225 [Anaerobacillus sp. HL2]
MDEKELWEIIGKGKCRIINRQSGGLLNDVSFIQLCKYKLKDYSTRY